MAKNTHAVAEARRFLRNGRDLYTLTDTAAGNAEYQHPISNNELSVGLNADLLDGLHASEISGGGGSAVTIVTNGNLPTPDSSKRGKLYIEPDAAGNDVLWICLADSGPGYDWYEIRRASP